MEPDEMHIKLSEDDENDRKRQNFSSTGRLLHFVINVIKTDHINLSNCRTAIQNHLLQQRNITGLLNEELDERQLGVVCEHMSLIDICDFNTTRNNVLRQQYDQSFRVSVHRRLILSLCTCM